MKKAKWVLPSLLAAAVALSSVPAAFAAVEDTGFSDVAQDAWYAQSVEYVTENGLMSGVGDGVFSPDTTTSRAMLAAILYRTSGSPTVTEGSSFSDVAEDAYYRDAAAWAAEEGLISGYGNGLFGSEDPVSREQLAAILWRYAGSPAAEASQDFADENEISSYALDAVDWARETGIISGREANRFAPKESASRGEVAAILYRFLTQDTAQNNTQQPAADDGDVLVVYFSATGNTERVANAIAQAADGDLFELEPVEPYTSDDLDWNDPDSRVVYEYENPEARDIPLLTDTVENWDSYDTVFIGYPIWWGISAWPVNTFVEDNDFTGKTVIPFCTSSSSSLGDSGALLEELAGTGNWQEGMRFRFRVSEEDVAAWVENLNLNAGNSQSAAENQNSRALVVYFSMPETTDPNDMTEEEANSTVVIDGQVLGNTQYMAQVIQETTGADIFRIEPQIPYPTDHDTLVDLAAEEQDNNARPAIEGEIENFDSYDVVFVGYPNWWGDMPMILYTFFDTYDFAGKTIIPFNTHRGSGFSATIDAIRQAEPQAQVLDGLSISRNRIQDAGQDIIDWVNSLEIE